MPGHDGGLFFPEVLLLLSPFLSGFFLSWAANTSVHHVGAYLRVHVQTIRNLHGEPQVRSDLNR